MHEHHEHDHHARPTFETIVTQVEKAHHSHGSIGHGHGFSHGHAAAGGAHHETYELSLLRAGPGAYPPHEHKKSRPPTPDPIVDTLTYRTSTRVIAVIDIVYSMVMVIFQLVVLIGGSSYRHNAEEALDENEAEMRKRNLTIGVHIWMGMFAVYIVQLLVAGALYGGTNERDARKTLRNCRIWCAMSIFLVPLLTLELVGIVTSKEIIAFLFPLLVYTSEFVFRLVGLVIISRFIKELNFELSDLAEGVKEVHYTQLPTASTHSPVHSIASSKNTEYEYLFQQSQSHGHGQDHQHQQQTHSPAHRSHHGHDHDYGSQGHGHGHGHLQHPSKNHHHHEQHQHQRHHQHIV